MTEHARCDAVLRDQSAQLGSEVDVFTEQPANWGDVTFDAVTDVWKCPHGQQYWMRPSMAQQIKWWRNRTP